MTGLRLVEGLDTMALFATTGFDLSNLTDSDQLGLAIDGGFLVRDGAHLRTTTAGRFTPASSRVGNFRGRSKPLVVMPSNSTCGTCDAIW